MQMKIHDLSEAKKQEESTLLEVLCEKKHNTIFSRDVENFRLHFAEILDELRSVKELEILQKMLAPARPTLSAFRHCEKISLKPSFTSLVPSNKNIHHQRLYKTKKNKPQRVGKLQLSHPFA